MLAYTIRRILVAIPVLLAVGTSLAAARGNLDEAHVRIGMAQARDRGKAHEDGMTKEASAASRFSPGRGRRRASRSSPR